MTHHCSGVYSKFVARRFPQDLSLDCGWCDLRAPVCAYEHGFAFEQRHDSQSLTHTDPDRIFA